jgi:hypothetical protein
VKTFNFVTLKTFDVNGNIWFRKEGEVWLDGYQRLANSPGQGGGYKDVRK